VSDAPSYHSTVPNTETIPAYTPRTTSTFTGSTSSNASSNLTPHHQRVNSVPSLLPSQGSQSTPTRGLPPVPSGPRGRSGSDSIPSLASFRIPSWSTVNANPTARHYHSVAHRRVAAARSDAAALDSLKRVVLERVEEEERVQARFRPLEDPHLVGEEAAARARRERLARENGDDVLIREDRRWDFFLGKFSLAPIPPFQPFCRLDTNCPSNFLSPDERLGRAREDLEQVPSRNGAEAIPG
jgi:hypothetical protein